MSDGRDDFKQSINDAVALAELKIRVSNMEKQYEEDIDTLREELKSLQKDRDSALRWGIMVLGTSVVSMAMWIAKLVVGKVSL